MTNWQDSIYFASSWLGGVYADFKSHKDLDALKRDFNFAGEFPKIKRVSVLHGHIESMNAEVVVGLQVTYQNGYSPGAHEGTLATGSQTWTHFDLDDDEYITSVQGRKGDYL